MNQAELTICAYCQKPIERPPDMRPVVYSHLKYHPGHCRKRARSERRTAREFPVPSQIAKRDMSEYIRATDLAKDAGVTVHAVFRWLKRYDFKRLPYNFVLHKKAYVRLDIAARYAETRAAKKPQGWVSFKSVTAELSCVETVGYRLLNEMVERGEITTINFKKVTYLSSADAARFLRLWRSTLPLAGWVSLRETADRAQVTYDAVFLWARRNGIPTRPYRDRSHNHVVLHMESRHAERYIAKDDPRRGYTRADLRKAA